MLFPSPLSFITRKLDVHRHVIFSLASLLQVLVFLVAVVAEVTAALNTLANLLPGLRPSPEEVERSLMHPQAASCAFCMICFYGDIYFIIFLS